MDNEEKMDQCDQYKKKGTFYYQVEIIFVRI